MDFVDLAEPEEGDKDCPRCDGTGWITVYELHWGGVDDDHEERCPKCNPETDEFMDEAEASPF